MSDVPKTLFNTKMYMIVKQYERNYIDMTTFDRNQTKLRIVGKINDV